MSFSHIPLEPQKDYFQRFAHNILNAFLSPKSVYMSFPTQLRSYFSKSRSSLSYSILSFLHTLSFLISDVFFILLLYPQTFVIDDFFSVTVETTDSVVYLFLFISFTALCHKENQLQEYLRVMVT